MNTLSLTSSVGSKGTNNKPDVIQVQTVLNSIADEIGLAAPLSVDGTIQNNEDQSPTCLAIGQFQKAILHFKKPDCRIDVEGKTYHALSQRYPSQRSNLFLPSIEPIVGLTESDFQQTANALDCEVAAIKAVSDVESKSSGFFPSGQPIILFEAHIFSKHTQHRYDNSHPDISSKRWDRSLYTMGEHEYLRLQRAMELDRHAALMSASFGRYQIMGFNHQAAGYNDVEAFVRDMFLSEANHLKAFASFIQSNSQLHGALKAKNWPYFARIYNGPGYSKNHYDEKLAHAYEKYNRA